MQESVARIASLLLAGTFLWGGAAKILAYERWRAVVARYDLPRAVGSVATPLVPALEIGVALTLAFVSPRAGAVVALAALSLFSLAVLRARAINGDRLPCGCFGGREERHYATMMWRNFALAVVAAIVLRGSRDSIAVGGSMPGRTDLLPVVLVVIGVVLALWMVSQLGSSSRPRGHS